MKIRIESDSPARLAIKDLKPGDLAVITEEHAGYYGMIVTVYEDTAGKRISIALGAGYTYWGDASLINLGVRKLTAKDKLILED